MHWIFEFGEEEGLVRVIDEKLEKLSLETESAVSEVPLQGEVLQVHPEISLQPTEKEKVRAYFFEDLVDWEFSGCMAGCFWIGSSGT